MRLQLREQRQDGVVILAPEGRLDSGKIEQFSDALKKRIQEGHRRLLIDCSNLVFAASSALRVLLLTVRKLNEGGGKLVLCEMNPHIRSIFDTAGFTKLMNIHDTFDEAFAEVRPAPTADATAADAETAPAEAAPAHAREDGPEIEEPPESPGESIVKRTVLAPFRLLAAVGRFLIR